jgi:hypothetical protein
MDGVQVSKLWVGVLAFAGGVFVGVQIAKAYAQNVIKSDVSSVLNKVGLGGGIIEDVADKLVVPQ